MRPDAPVIELWVLGSTELRRDGRPAAAVLAQPKRLALLTYLALAPDRSFRRRDTAAAILWPDLDQEHARGSLRQALRFLRRELGEEVIRNRGEEEIGLDFTLVWCDALAFQGAARERDPGAATDLYRGDLLEGFFVGQAAPDFDRWVEAERLRLRTLAIQTWWARAEQERQADRTVEAVAAAKRAVRLAPEDETAVCRLLRMLDQSGDRAGAIATYEEFARRLASEYQAEPAAETQALIRAIRVRSDPGVPPAAASAPGPAAGAGSAPPAAHPAAAPRRPDRALPVVPLLTGLVILLLAGYLLATGTRGAGGSTPRMGVAVLPVDDLTGDTVTRYLAEAVADQLTTDLAGIRALSVINRRTMQDTVWRGRPNSWIMQRLGVDALLVSSLQRFGDTVRLRVQMVKAGSPEAAWAESYSGTLREVLGWQQRVAMAVAEQARIELSAPERAALAADRAVDPEAVALYTRGRWWWNKRGQANLFRALNLFNASLDVDPTYALAWSAKADAYAQIGYGSFLAPGEAFPKAVASARRALELDSTLAEPHAALAFAAMYYDWDWDAAEIEYRKAITLNPSYATTHEWYGLFLAAMGRFDEAVAEAQRAEALDPLSASVAGTRGWVLHYAGRNDEALRVLRVALRTDSANPVARLYLGRVHHAAGNLDSAMTHYAATGPIRGWVPVLASEAGAEAAAGRRGAARALLARMDSMARTEYVTPYALALVHAALGEQDEAFAQLDRGLQDRAHWLLWLNRDFRWSSLRPDPRFRALTRRIGLPP